MNPKLTITDSGEIFLDDVRISRCLSVDVSKINPLKPFEVTLHVLVREADIHYRHFGTLKDDTQAKPLKIKTATDVEVDGGNEKLQAQISALVARMTSLEEERKQTRKALYEMLDTTEQLFLKFTGEYGIKFSGFSVLSILKQME